MLLKEWLEKHGIVPYRFAKSIGLGSSTLYKNILGVQRMSANTAVLVEQATKGEVSRTEALWPEIFQDKKDKRVID